MAGEGKSHNRICKSIHQYSKNVIPNEEMQKLKDIAQDYMKVKNHVYQRYGGIKSLSKIYPGYAVEKEITNSGLREQLGLPSVYFSPAVFDALGDIKTQWAQVKNNIYATININERFTPWDKHYLRFVMKVNECFVSILNQKELVLPTKLKRKYESIIADLADDSGVHIEKLNRYLCRQVRKNLHKLHTDNAMGFIVKNKGYKYGTFDNEHGIFLTTKEKGKRMFISLTDKNIYDRMLYIRLKPEKNGIEIDVPLFVKVRNHKDYVNEVGLSPGLWHMFTTNTGKVYGEHFGELQKGLTDYMVAAGRTYAREKENNSGREKYQKHKAKLVKGIETYINAELNRMLAMEKPHIIYIPKQPHNAGGSSGNSYLLRTWRKGIVYERLQWKCRKNAVDIIEVFGKDLSVECSQCGAQGQCKGNQFRCTDCGYEADKKTNAAQNAIKRGKNGKCIN